MTKVLVSVLSILGFFYVIELQETKPQTGNILLTVLVILWIGSAIQSWRNSR